MRKSKPTTCGKCGGNTPPFTLFANAATAESYALCVNCMGNQASNHIDDLAELDGLIAEHEDMLEKMEIIVKEAGDMKMPPELEAFAFTPLSSYKMIQMTLASLKTKRVELLSSGENEHRLKYELDKKVAEEKYEEASNLHKRLNDLQANPKKKRRFTKRNKKKTSANLFASKEQAAGRCIRCNDRFPKPPGLLSKYDIGNCQEMCLPCCIHEVPKLVHSVEIADQMIADMQRFSKMMNGMSLMGKLMTEGQENLDYDTEKAKLEKKVHPESKMMIDRLEIRKAFLLDPTKKSENSEELEMWKKLISEATGNDKDLLKVLLHALDSPAGKQKWTTNKKTKAKAKKKASRKKKAPLSAKAILRRGEALIKASKEETLCPKCNKHPVKPAIIFEDYDLGDCHEVCLICSMVKLPLMADTVQMADEMIAEMKGISEFLDELLVIGELYAAGEQEKAKHIKIKEMDVEVKMPEQYIVRRVIEVLEIRRKFLVDIGENDELKDLADTFIRLLRDD